MGEFIQLHILTSYPPSNLNRDDLGRPKTAIMGGAQRLRVSSQSLKRAWRTSVLFRDSLVGHMGIRTKDLGRAVHDALINGWKVSDVVAMMVRKDRTSKPDSVFEPVDQKSAKEWASAIAGMFGKLKGKSGKKKDPLEELEIEQLAHVGPEDVREIDNLILKLVTEKRSPEQKELEGLFARRQAADVAMFGRMLASSPANNIEAATQVAHAITVHKAAVEDDFFTAVDDLNEGVEDIGAAHMGETEFGSGLYYLYVCIDRALLLNNLGGDEDLAVRSLRAFAEAALTVSPTGKQNSFASRACASYCLAEKGRRQPRSLSVSFLKPVDGTDLLGASIARLGGTRDNMDKVYGKMSDEDFRLSVPDAEGTLAGILDFLSTPLPLKETI